VSGILYLHLPTSSGAKRPGGLMGLAASEKGQV